MFILENYVFLDVEASSLHMKRSYPVQIGWAVPTISLDSEVFLISPAPTWTDWSSQSQHVHGISRNQCIAYGTPPRQVAERLNERMAGKRVFTDAPEFDGYWVGRLFKAAGVDQTFRIEDESLAFRDAIMEVGGDQKGWLRQFSRIDEWASIAYPHTHKADEDAIQRAAVMRAIVDPVLRADMKARYDAGRAIRQPRVGGR